MSAPEPGGAIIFSAELHQYLHHQLNKRRIGDDYASDHDLDLHPQKMIKASSLPPLPPSPPPPLSSPPSIQVISPADAAIGGGGGISDDAGSSSSSPVVEVDDSRIRDSISSQTSTSAPSSSSSDQSLQFFVRLLSPPALVVRLRPTEAVSAVMDRIESVTRIPRHDLRLIHHGRQLDLEETLLRSGVKDGETIDLTCRLRSTRQPRAWYIVNDLVRTVRVLEIFSVSDPDQSPESILVRRRYDVDRLVKQFLTTTLLDADGGKDEAAAYLRVFTVSGATSALVKLYLSPILENRVIGESSIRIFLSRNSDLLPELIRTQCAPILLHFCQLIGAKAGREDPLYTACRSTLASILKDSGCSLYTIHHSSVVMLMELHLFISELVELMEKELSASYSSVILSNIITDLSNFLSVARRIIQDWKGMEQPVAKQLYDTTNVKYENGIGSLYELFIKLVGMVELHLRKMDGERILADNDKQQRDVDHLQGFSNFLTVLTVIKVFSKMFEEGEDLLYSTLNKWRSLLNVLLKGAKRNPALRWFLKYKDILDFEARMNLVLMMLPEGKEEDEMFEMLIDRPQMLNESFEYINQADATTLHGGLFLEFKNEEATGPGVLREWFCLVCRAIFDPQNALFLQCPNDRRRLFPNPDSSVNPLHLKYFHFSGRIIALALMHKIQVGIMFDRVFFVQLAGKMVSLEDVQSADPALYSSCKQILEMDSAFLDSDALGLTFSREAEVLGSKKTLEFYTGGKDIIVNSRNRTNYINLLVYDCFVKSISEQVTQFAQGFGDILTNSKHQQFFFHSLDLEDFNQMLAGNNGTISVKEWKSYTDYNGYKATDHQIKWFWETVQGMSDDQRKTLLFFWTSVKFLPVNGFEGLSSRLHIYKASVSQACLPTAHTCFFRLCLPAYEKKSIVHDRLNLITQDYVGCSFGTW